MDITRQLFELTGISDSTQILYPGDTARAKQPGSAVDGNSTDPSFSSATTPFTSRMFVEVEEVEQADRLLATAVFGGENLPVFRDDRVETIIAPVYSTQEMVINFRYRAQDKTMGLRWRDEIRGKTPQLREQFLHDITYHYNLPPEYMVILEEIHRMREAVAPYGETFEQWFGMYSSQRVGQITTMAGSQPSWTVAETQTRVIGYFDFEGVPEKGEKDSEGDTWIISFAYKFRYDKPVGAAMSYPLMVHNQLIKYRPDQPENLLDAKLRSYSQSGLNFRFFEQGNKLLGISNGVAIPSFDEFIPSSVPLNTTRVFTALTSVSTDPAADPLVLFNLGDLGSQVSLDPAVLAFLQGEVPYLTKLYASPFLVSLYRDTNLLPATKLTVDASLNVRSTEPLDLRHYYHVRFGLLDDLSLLTADAQARLRKNADVLGLIFVAQGAEMCVPPTLAANYVTKTSFGAAVDCSNRAKLAQGDGQIRQFNTVMTLFLISDKITNYATR